MMREADFAALLHLVEPTVPAFDAPKHLGRQPAGDISDDAIRAGPATRHALGVIAPALQPWGIMARMAYPFEPDATRAS